MLRHVNTAVNIADSRIPVRVLLRQIEEGVSVQTFREKVRVITRIINSTLQVSHTYRLRFARTISEPV